jgi:hypothetical protein
MMRILASSFARSLVPIVMALCGCGPHGTVAGVPAGPVPGTFAALASDATTEVTTRWYSHGNTWLDCTDPSCGSRGNDWGVDSMVNVLYERWELTRDPVVSALLKNQIEGSELPFPSPCMTPCGPTASDVAMWDAVAALRTYAVTGNQNDLGIARMDYNYVAHSALFALGQCPDIDFQLTQYAGGAQKVVKTLETDANRILAAVLLWDQTKDPALLSDARAMYAAVRRRYLDPALPLYTVYVRDDSTTCTQIPQRFFASVNGVMIEAGLELSRATGDQTYATDAAATKHAIAQLADNRGIFADLQAENDIVEPLVIAMLRFASDLGDGEAREWIIRNAAAAANARTADGTAYGRFFDGPPPAPGTISTIWQTNGGFALMIAAGYLSPSGVPEPQNFWQNASVRNQEVTTALPSVIPFTGSAVALFGTIGETSAEPGHAHILIDGQQMTDLTGIWQNKDLALTPNRTEVMLPNSVLFAWRWPSSGAHTLTILPGEANEKEGSSFVHIRYELIVP